MPRWEEYQLADADLTALAALSTTGVLARTGAGTFATRTLTQTANQVLISNAYGTAGNPTFTASQDLATTSNVQFGSATLSRAGVALSGKNTTDGASVQAAILEGDRATMADNDEAYLTFRLSDDGGTQTEVARLTWVATDVNVATSVDGRIDFAVMTAGTLADELQLDGTALSPSTNDGLALGTASLGFSDLFLAAGAVINGGAGDVLLTFGANELVMTGGNLGIGLTSPGTYNTNTVAVIVGSTTVTETGQVGIVGNVTSDGAIADLAFHNQASTAQVSKRVAVIRVSREGNNDDASMAFFTQDSVGGMTKKFQINDTGLVDVTNFINWAGQKRVTAQFDKTTDTTLANVTGLSVTVAASTVYYFEAILFVDANATGGHKYGIAGTATATGITYYVQSWSDTTNVSVINQRQTSLGASIGQAGATTICTRISGTIRVNAAGTLTVQFAQNAATGTSSVLVDSTFVVQQVA